MKKTYLLGAGASANAVPVNANTLDELDYIINQLALYKSSDSSLNKKIEYLTIELNWLFNTILHRATMDTAAFTAFQNEDFDKYNRIKNAIGIYMIFAQLNLKHEGRFNSSENPPKQFIGDSKLKVHKKSKVRLDPRYDTFLSQELKNDLPHSDLKVLSYNYDLQFELSHAFRSPLSSGITDINQGLLGIEVPSRPGFTAVKKKTIYKINGNSDYYNVSEDKFDLIIEEVDNTFSYILNRVIEKLVYCSRNEEWLPGISFAWERKITDPFIEKMLSDIEDTRTLVIVGYSFHSFNEAIDRVILETISSRVERIIIKNRCSPSAFNEMKKLIIEFTKNNGLGNKIIHDSDASTFYTR